jgi:hypothetical protein
MKYDVRASDWMFRLEWNQKYSNPYLGAVDFGYGKKPLRFLVSKECPIVIDEIDGFVDGGLPTAANTSLVGRAACSDGNRKVSWMSSTYNIESKKGIFEVPVDYKKQDVYVVIAHKYPVTITIGRMAAHTRGFRDIWLYTNIVIGSISFLVLTIFFFLTLGCLARRKTRANIKERYSFNIAFLLSIVFLEACIFAGSIVLSALELFWVDFRPRGYRAAMGINISLLLTSIIFYLLFRSGKQSNPKIKTYFILASILYIVSAAVAFLFTFYKDVTLASNIIVYIMLMLGYLPRLSTQCILVRGN